MWQRIVRATKLQIIPLNLFHAKRKKICICALSTANVYLPGECSAKVTAHNRRLSTLKYAPAVSCRMATGFPARNGIFSPLNSRHLFWGSRSYWRVTSSKTRQTAYLALLPRLGCVPTIRSVPHKPS